MKPNNCILALDIGGRRIGVAIATAAARIPSALDTLIVDDTIADKLQAIVQDNEVKHIVIGLPRNLNGDETEQTRTVRAFAETLQSQLSDVTFSFQDEAVTSRQAEQELQARGRPYEKADIDALAATYILEDYLRSNTVEVI